ncbi:hypothetical protein QTP88_023522 [Uroleucon formosanum]
MASNVYERQVSSEEVTELDKMAVNLVHSLFDIVEIPYRKIENIINPSEAGLEKLPFLEDLAIKLKRKKEEIEKTYMESLTPEIRELEKNRLREYANTSQKIIKSIQDFKKMARSMINAYFNNLPKNVQNKLIGLGQDLNNILHKLKELSKNGSSEVKHK